MGNDKWMIKNIESEPLAVSGKVVKPDLVLVEGNLRQVVTFVGKEGIVKRLENAVPFSRQITMPGALPGYSVKAEVEVHNAKPHQGARVCDTTLLTIFVTVEDSQGIIGFRSEDFLLNAVREIERPIEPVVSAVVEEEETDKQQQVERLREELETEYALRYEHYRLELEKQLRDSYQDDLRQHLEQLRVEMHSELKRRWKQQLSAYQYRNGYRGSVEFGRA